MVGIKSFYQHSQALKRHACALLLALFFRVKKSAWSPRCRGERIARFDYIIAHAVAFVKRKNERISKNNEQKFENPLDKRTNVWYNVACKEQKQLTYKKG